MSTSIKSIQVAVLAFIHCISFSSCNTDPGKDSLDNPDPVYTYTIVGTSQDIFYNNSTETDTPLPGSDFYGQDACYPGNIPSYEDNGDGTISDMHTGLMWAASPDLNEDGDINAADKLSYQEALEGAASFTLAGYSDWRIPSIKELYSLIIFSGTDPSGYRGSSSEGLVPFLNTDYFSFGYGDVDAGERIIDAQFATSTLYVSETMRGNETMFGVNFADGRIKGYPYGVQPGRGESKKYYVLYVRGNESYGYNELVDNGDGTINDKASGLMWMQADNGEALSWEEALSFAEDFSYAGKDDWRLPDAKELQSIVDYRRSPATDSSASIDPIFECTSIFNEAGEADFPYYWTGTTHSNLSANSGRSAVYLCFGKGLGYMNGWIDVHGAGAQRSDPKTGEAEDYPFGRGPQGDAIRIYNYVRLVRNID